MVFSSFTFLLLFLPCVLALNAVSTNIRWRNGILLVSSLVFYGWGEPVYILCMLLSSLVNFFAARAVCRTQRVGVRRFWLVLGVVMSVAFLFWFKYAAFFYNTFAGLLRLPPFQAPELPIGISFYTFQVLTYTVDVYRGKAQPQARFSDLLLYISCFPQLIAGPIVQYGDVAQALTQRGATADKISGGLKRFCLGLGKKVLLANLCGAALEQLPHAGDAMSLSGAWLAAVLYALQLYYDFSAYSDMAIGLGRVLGFRYKENFDYPYISKSISEFWRRWHISLGAFFRDYVYIPLGGNRVSKPRLLLNLMIVWSLTGFWHGASWNFLAWGAYYGVLIILERLVWPGFLKKAPAPVLHLYSLLAVLVGWVLFYYVDIRQAGIHLLALVGLAPGGTLLPLTDAMTVYTLKQYALLYPFAVLCATPVVPWLRTLVKKLPARPARAWEVGETAALSVLLVLSLVILLGQSYNPFIYFRF